MNKIAMPKFSVLFYTNLITSRSETYNESHREGHSNVSNLFTHEFLDYIDDVECSIWCSMVSRLMMFQRCKLLILCQSHASALCLSIVFDNAIIRAFAIKN